MLQVCHPTGGNRVSAKNNSTFVNFMNSEGNIVPHMELTLYKTTCENQTLKKSVFIFSGYEYIITFFDVSDGSKKSVTCLVQSINGDNSNPAGQSLTVKYINNAHSTSSDNYVNVVSGLGCGCIFNKPDGSKYEGPITVTIPIVNITDIQYVKGSSPIAPEVPKKGVKVVLLGISAEFVRSVIINLKMIDDNAEDAVKDVYMKVGGTYNIAYIDSTDRSVYEVEGKLLAINETDQQVSNNTVVRRSEQCGMGNSLYSSKCDCECSTTDRDEFMNSDGLENEVLLTFDCSTDFSGHYHTIKLSTIRDCTVVSESGTSDDSYISGNDCSCNCNSAPIKLTSGNTKITIDPNTKEITYTGGSCTMFGKTTLQEVIDYYFGG